MLLHATVILIQCAAVGGFLILWYLWLKKKLLYSLAVDDTDQVLFPFKYFSWVLLAAIVATSLAQVHYVRSSAVLQDRMVQMANHYGGLQAGVKSVKQAQDTIEELRKEVASLSREMRSQALFTSGKPAGSMGPLKMETVSDEQPKKPQSGPSQMSALMEHDGEGFSGEAKAASGPRPDPVSVTDKPDGRSDQSPLIMSLNRTGKVTVDKLRVRHKPESDSIVLEKLDAGQQVKITEKRLFRDSMWFRVVTPSGRAGWVDYRFIKLQNPA